MAEVINNADSANRLMLEGFRIGASKNAADLDRNVRIQELRSQQAHRQFMERMDAKRVEMMLEDARNEIDLRSDLAKASVEFELNRTARPLSDPDDTNGQMMTTPMSDSDNYAKTYLPVLMKRARTPGEAANAIGVVPLMKQREANAEWQQARPGMAQDTLESRERVAEENRLSREKIAGENATLRKDLQDTKLAADEEKWRRTLENRTEIQKLRNQARKEATEGRVSREQYLNRHVNQTAKEIAASSEARKGKWDTRTIHGKALDILSDWYEQDIESKREGGSTPETKPSSDPKKGDVLKGYRYNGKFPPSDKRAWDKVNE